MNIGKGSLIRKKRKHRNTKKRSYLLELPNEIFLSVCSFLHWSELFTLELVCSQTKSLISNTDLLWKSQFKIPHITCKREFLESMRYYHRRGSWIDYWKKADPHFKFFANDKIFALELVKTQYHSFCTYSS
jgi:hypothetical protein